MKTSMLEYVKTILRKVSFDRKLFRKEYRKSLLWLSGNDARELKQWLRHQGLSMIPQKQTSPDHKVRGRMHGIYSDFSIE